MSFDTLNSLVNLECYPIHDLGGRGARLLEKVRARMEVDALCCLPDFINPSALRCMVQEILTCQGKAYPIESQRTAYSWVDRTQYPLDHAVNITSEHKLASVTRDSMGDASVLVSLFHCNELTEFVRECFGIRALYRVTCPFLSLNVKIMDQGARHGWHFDNNDGAVSLLLQEAKQGGEYEYVPYLRSDKNENYDGVRSVLRGDRSNVRIVAIRAGTLCLFRGGRSLHRVSHIIEGSPDRLTAILSYSDQPNHFYNENTLRTVLGQLPTRSVS